GPLHLRRDTPVELRPNVLGAERTCEGRAQNEGKGQADGPHSCAPCAVTATTLLGRPKPSSTAGAPGSTTQRAPSTTNAYSCWPTGRARVVVHTAPVPACPRGAARRSH